MLQSLVFLGIYNFCSSWTINNYQSKSEGCFLPEIKLSFILFYIPISSAAAVVFQLNLKRFKVFWLDTRSNGSGELIYGYSTVKINFRNLLRLIICPDELKKSFSFCQLRQKYNRKFLTICRFKKFFSILESTRLFGIIFL